MMREMRSRGAAAFLAVAAVVAVAGTNAAAAAAQSQGSAAASFRRCGPDTPTERCGRVTVPLDRTGTLAGTVKLNVRIVSPWRRRANGTVVALAGGPGQAAASLADEIADALGPVARTRRVVTFDQRGTGRSGRLRCPGLSEARTRRELAIVVGACAELIGPRRTAYTTSASVDDLEAVRFALGVDRIALFAVSYGTKVALDYAARYPQHVSRLVLDSVVPPASSDPFMRRSLASARRILREICVNGGCRFTRDPATDLATVVAALQQKPQSGDFYDGRGRPHRLTMTADRLVNLLFAGDFDPFLRARMPAALHSAARGDLAALLRLLATTGNEGLDDTSGDSDALYIATSCEDGGVPWPAGTPVQERPAAFERELAAVPLGQIAPFDHATLRKLGVDYCSTWPESPIAQPSAPLPDVPTLILSGDEDLRTPRADAEAVAAQLPRATLVKVPNTGHSALTSDYGTCAAGALARFFAGRRARECSRRGRALLQPSRPAPTSFSQLRPVTGVPGRAGRTLTAVDATFGAMTDDLIPLIVAALSEAFSDDGADIRALRVGGLRGGVAALTENGFVLRDYRVVPGVTLTGTIGDRIVLRVGGRAAARGTLRSSRGAIRGRLGGRAIRVPLRSLASIEAFVSGAGDGIADPRTALEQARQLAAALPGPTAQPPAVGPLRAAR